MNGAIEWFTRNRVAANLLAAMIIVAGLLTLNTITEEVFPEFDVDLITVSVVHPGASPEEVEEGICVRIEERLQGLDGVKRVGSTASESVGVVNVELLSGADARRVLDDVKSRVDGIDTFPDEAEEPVIQQPTMRKQVLNVAVHGDAGERTLKALGEQVRDELAALPGITQVELANARDYEIAIEVSESGLRRWNLSFDEVAAAVRRGSIDLPGGELETSSGEILLRTKGQAYRGAEFEQIVLRTRADGTRLLLGDVATVVDGFENSDKRAAFDGSPSVLVQVFRVGKQSALDISQTVRAYTAEAGLRMPEGVKLTVWQDDSLILSSRLDTLKRNGRSGLILVFIVLALFLRLRLAFWVSLGVPVAFLGAISLMPVLGITMNALSLFAFIVVLGIVVDDAIVVAESIHSHREQGKSSLRAAIEGSHEVATPVIFAVLTSIVAFLPMAFVPGTTGRIWRVIPMIVIACLLFSLVESKLILPAHLSKGLARPKDGPGRGLSGAWRRFQTAFADGVQRLAMKSYRPSLEWALRWRYLTVAAAVALLIVTGGLVRGGWVKLVFFPPVEADFVYASLTMPQGSPVSVTESAVNQLQDAAQQLAREIDGSEVGGGSGVFRHVMASVGEQPSRGAAEANGGGLAGSYEGTHLGEVTIELAPSEQRSVTSQAIARRWRELTGEIPGATQLSFVSDLFQAGEAVNIQFMGPDVDELKELAGELKSRLADYAGVVQIADSGRAGKQEVLLQLKPEAELLGLRQVDLARQVRQAFYGEEAQRVQRGRDDVKVMVRYPASERTSLEDLENLRVRTPDGGEVPFAGVAEVSLGRGFESIRRSDRRRAINVTAEVEGDANPNEVTAWVTGTVLPEILRDHPQVAWKLEGERREQGEVLSGLFRGFLLAMIGIYALMAIPFRSYLQPIVVMLAIPFGLVGAIGGHLVMGEDLSVLSLCGMVALAGVVVNDSLVLVDFVNKRRREGLELMEALRTAGVARFRPILITSLTTFAGLTPLMMEQSVQAKFLVPMAISLAFGVLFATFISLVLVPAGYAIVEDLVALGQRLLGRGGSEDDEELGEAAPA